MKTLHKHQFHEIECRLIWLCIKGKDFHNETKFQMHIHSCNNQTIQNVQRFDFPTHTYDFIQPLNIPNTLFKAFITKCIYKAHKHN